jgi:hypothetical protein
MLGAVRIFLRAEDPLTRLERAKVREGLRPDITRVDASKAWYLRDRAASPESVAMWAESSRLLAFARATEREAILGWMADRSDVEIAAQMGVSGRWVRTLRDSGLRRIRAAVRRGVRPPAIDGEGHGGRNVL